MSYELPGRDLSRSGRRPGEALRTAGGALLSWGRAATIDALIVGCLWLVGLELLHVPWAPLWAVIGAVCQFIPGVGGMLSVIGPVLSTVLTVQTSDDWYRLGYVLGLYGLIAVLEGLVIGPLYPPSHDARAVVGLAAWADRPRHPDSALGRSDRATPARRHLRLSST